MGNGHAVLSAGWTHLQHLQNENAEDDAAHARDQRQQNALGDNLRENHARRSADGASDANLRGALAHGHHHDVAHTDGTGQQGADTDEPHEEVDTAEEAVEHGEHHLSVDDGERLLVVGRHVVCMPHHLTDARHQSLRPYAGPRHEADHRHAVTAVVGLLHQREGNGQHILAVAADAHGTRGGIDTDNIIVSRVNAYQLARRVTAVGKEVAVNALSEHTYLTMLRQVHSIDIPAVAHLRFLYFGIVGRHTAEVARRLLIAEISRTAPVHQQGRDHAKLRQLVGQRGDIAQGQSPRPTLAVAVVRFGRGVGVKNGAVGGETREVIVE